MNVIAKTLQMAIYKSNLKVKKKKYTLNYYTAQLCWIQIEKREKLSNSKDFFPTQTFVESSILAYLFQSPNFIRHTRRMVLLIHCSQKSDIQTKFKFHSCFDKWLEMPKYVLLYIFTVIKGFGFFRLSIHFQNRNIECRLIIDFTPKGKSWKYQIKKSGPVNGMCPGFFYYTLPIKRC